MYTISFSESGKPFILPNINRTVCKNILNTILKGAIQGTFQVEHLTISKH